VVTLAADDVLLAEHPSRLAAAPQALRLLLGAGTGSGSTPTRLEAGVQSMIPSKPQQHSAEQPLQSMTSGFDHADDLSKLSERVTRSRTRIASLEGIGGRRPVDQPSGVTSMRR
jgi:hypothetical protein